MPIAERREMRQNSATHALLLHGKKDLTAIHHDRFFSNSPFFSWTFLWYFVKSRFLSSWSTITARTLQEI
jgi:hypothetical protein